MYDLGNIIDEGEIEEETSQSKGLIQEEGMRK